MYICQDVIDEISKFGSHEQDRRDLGDELTSLAIFILDHNISSGYRRKWISLGIFFALSRLRRIVKFNDDSIFNELMLALSGRIGNVHF